MHALKSSKNLTLRVNSNWFNEIVEFLLNSFYDYITSFYNYPILAPIGRGLSGKKVKIE